MKGTYFQSLYLSTARAKRKKKKKSGGNGLIFITVIHVPLFTNLPLDDELVEELFKNLIILRVISLKTLHLCCVTLIIEYTLTVWALHVLSLSG